MSKFSFPKTFRLKREKLFELVFSQGRKTAGKNLIMRYFMVSEAEPAAGNENKKIGIIVSKKFGKSVERNRFRRLIREAFRLSKHNLKDGTYIIISPRAGCKIKNLSDAMKELEELWIKLKIWR
ncbi:MAG: ribonuclease P protein component [Elusimicrobia bacterium]|nr:ribonuclease P protein component [Elusimicrobiota bacterium]